VLLDGGLQRCESKALQLAVDGERQVAAVLRRADRLHVLDDAAEAILQHPPRARLAAQMRLEGELDAFLTAIVDAGEPDDVRRHLTAGIVAAELAVLVDAL
jgi:hypothetical protein